MRGAIEIGGKAVTKDDLANVTRYKSSAAKRVQAHRRRRRMGLRCLTVRVNDRVVRHLISTGYLSLESKDRRGDVTDIRRGDDWAYSPHHPRHGRKGECCWLADPPAQRWRHGQLRSRTFKRKQACLRLH